MFTVTFALPDESREFRKYWSPDPRSSQSAQETLQGSIHGVPVSIGHVGVGPRAAGVGIRKLLEEVRPKLLICAGYGGALDPTLNVGDLVLDARHASNHYPRGGIRVGRIHSRATAAERVEDKRALLGETGASVVDMETATVAGACAAAGIPMLALRVVSDSATQPLPVPMTHWFDIAKQRPRPLTLLAFLALHPAAIVPFAKFVHGLSGARASLAIGISDLISEFAQSPLTTNMASDAQSSRSTAP